jgi:serine protease Do
LEQTVSEGIVSSIRENESMDSKVIQTTAAISPGSSGSPVFNMDGEVIGIATYQYSNGQLLNFAVPSSRLDLLSTVHGLALGQKDLSNRIILNQQCEFNSELTLNSLEYLDNKTVAYFTFTNVTIGYGDYMIIYSDLSDPKARFFIQDNASNVKYQAIRTSIGNSRSNPTEVPLGAAISFTVEFEPVPRSATKISVLEGIGGSWKFLNLNLLDFVDIESTDVSEYNDNVALTKIKNSDYDGAMRLLSSTSNSKNALAASSYNIMGIIAYKRDNNYNSIEYFTEAIDRNPTNDIFYFNRAKVYADKKQELNLAIEDISNALSIRPTQGDYYYHRGALYMQIKDFASAMKDLELANNMIGENGTVLTSLGICKLVVSRGDEGCADIQRAYEVETDADSKIQIKQIINNNCN